MVFSNVFPQALDVILLAMSAGISATTSISMMMVVAVMMMMVNVMELEVMTDVRQVHLDALAKPITEIQISNSHGESH